MQVDPKFHEDASNLEQLVPFEECIELHSSNKAVVKAPEYLLLTHNGRSFKLVSMNSLFAFLYNSHKGFKSFSCHVHVVSSVLLSFLALNSI